MYRLSANQLIIEIEKNLSKRVRKREEDNLI